ncbi:hypothetical protein [Hymenobacter sp. YC55]|uniref:hypothetical protein n=1 Tax=Hymenobacter sp. YC55 TaxID=3034019 RepID=UPI0023F73367|nr:hypothetical protein [Hymenobacter sp. YC55]MDF7813045.1 hypothetical protein [Hymenobacter sp. YC55]
MATSAPNTTPDPRPTGDLEHLFRQKFSEAEVTPRAGLWEQLDHELLVEQNNNYRRRLRVHRWVAAACLLFFLSMGGWALLHQWQAPTSGLATGRAGSGINATSSNGNQSALASTNTDPNTGSASADPTATESASLLGDATAASSTNELLAAENGNAATALAPGLAANRYGSSASYNPNGASQATGVGSSITATAMNTTNPGFGGSRSSASGASLMAAQFGNSYSGTENSMTMSGWNGITPRFAGLRGGWLGSRPDTLKPSLLAAPQPALGMLAAAQDETTPSPTKKWRRLRFGGGYGASAYNPNVDFSQSNGQAFASSADMVSTALRNYYQEDAEAEYRRNLRAGVSQRVAFKAAYSVSKRLTVSSGVEAGQQTATSATSYDFLDGRLVSPPVANSLSNTAFYSARNSAAPIYMRKTSYRYRTVAVPVEVRYGSQRTGTSLYAKVGAAVGLLLSTKSELENYSAGNRAPSTFAPAGSPSTTQRYSLSSSDSPYRKVQASVRGGAGVRYQPANATWNLVLGTTTEMGLTSLNTDPGQRGLSQRRPYSVGMEASVEFNSHKPTPAAP